MHRTVPDSSPGALARTAPLGLVCLHAGCGADAPVAASTTTYVGDPELDIPTYVTRETYAHDASGRLTGIDVDEGDVDTLLRCEYDVDGNMIRLVETGADGALIETREYRYEATDAPIYNRWTRALASFL